MANTLTAYPMVIDTDITSFRQATAVVNAGWTQGIRVDKLVLAVDTTGASTAGTVTITAPSDSSVLYPPLIVAASTPAGTIIYTDDPAANATGLTWRDFAVTGVTATGTRLFIWWRV